jgi:thioredoxin reductase
MSRSSKDVADCQMLVVGGGPAGCSAAVTAHSLGVTVKIIERHRLGGQVREIDKISNLLGGPHVGENLAGTFSNQIEQYGIPVVHTEAVSIKRLKRHWKVFCGNGEVIRAETIVAATGSRELRLGEHSLITNVGKAHKDRYIYEVAIEELLSKNIVVVGSDRVILTLVASKGAKLKKASIKVLALPDKWYVIESEIKSLPFEVIKVSRILGVHTETSGDTIIEYRDPDGAMGIVNAELVLTNLGKVPNSDLFWGHMEHDSDGFLSPKNYLGRARPETLYAVGDVAHKAFQRISVAIGDGAYAALDYFYGREQLYPSRSK